MCVRADGWVGGWMDGWVGVGYARHSPPPVAGVGQGGGLCGGVGCRVCVRHSLPPRPRCCNLYIHTYCLVWLCRGAGGLAPAGALDALTLSLARAFTLSLFRFLTITLSGSLSVSLSFSVSLSRARVRALSLLLSLSLSPSLPRARALFFSPSLSLSLPLDRATVAVRNGPVGIDGFSKSGTRYLLN